MQNVHAFGDDALADHDAVALAQEIRAGRLLPSEAIEAAIGRVEKVDGELNAIAYRAFDEARIVAHAADDEPTKDFLHGVPTLIKDNVDVAGWPTMDGTDAWDPKPAQADGDFAAMFLQTGLIALGKTQLSEYGFSAAAEHPRIGAVRNPWDTDRSAGASSAGSAALVAAGAVPLAHANDGGGSIRIPASVNGLVGLKPTRGRLAQDKLMRQMPIRIVSDGVVTRSVRDTAAFFREAEKHYRALGLSPIGDITRPIQRPLTVAVNTSGLGRGADAEVTALTQETAVLLEELGHRVEPVEVPVAESFPDDFLLYWGFLALAMLTAGRPTHGRSWRRGNHDNLTLGLSAHARRNMHRLPGAIRRLRRTTAQAEAFHQQYDVVLTPTLATPTPKVGHLDPTQDYAVIVDKLLDWVAFTPLQNVTGAPAVSLPLCTTSTGLPQGMMFGAGMGGEALLLGLAYQLEEARPFARIQA